MAGENLITYSSPFLGPQKSESEKSTDWTTYSGLLSGLGSILGAGAAGAAAYYGKESGQDTLYDLANQMGGFYGDVRDDVGTAAEFKPYAVTGTSGGATFGEKGLDLGPNVTQQGFLDQANAMRGQMGMSPDMTRALQGYGSGALSQSQQAMGANTGRFASQLGGQYAGMGETLIGTQAPQDLAQLQGLFAQQAQGQQAGSLGDLTGQLQYQAQGALSSAAPDVTGAYSGITAPQVSTAAGDVASQYLAAGGGMLSSPTAGAEDIYNQIRATQSPEEERQRLALENRLAAQGRLGVSTAAYGGTPEQLAMEKAQAEARNAASLQAIGMADQLATSQQNRAQQLTQMGLSADQIQQQMINEGFGQEMSLAGAQLQTAQTQESLQTASQNRAAQLAQLGMSAEQIDSQLANEGLNRQTTSAGLAANLAQTGAGIQSQQQQLGQGLLGLGLQAQQLGGQLGQQDIANAASLFGIGQQSALLPSQLEGAQLANISQMLGASNIPFQQQLAASQLGLTAQNQQAQLQQEYANLAANLGLSEAGLMKELALGGAGLEQEFIKSLGNIGAGLAGIEF
jgi:hypothetical protein